ncbi:MAG: hypothetical protein ACLFSC_01310 [Wenzhouxiangella sp.]
MKQKLSKTFEAKIQPWGNSMGLRLTRAVRDLAELQEGCEVTLEITADGLLIRKKDRPAKPWTEHELLAGLTPHTAHADELPQLLAQETD